MRTAIHIGSALVVVVALSGAYGVSYNIENLTAIEPGYSTMYRPDVDGDYAVWYGTDQTTLETNISVWDLPSDDVFVIATLSGAPMYVPNIAGQYVVWSDSARNPGDPNSYVYAYNVSTRSQSTVAALRNPPVTGPTVGGHYVIWLDSGEPGDDHSYVCAHDLSARTTFAVARLSTLPMYTPETDGEYVVWWDSDPADANSHLYGCELASRSKFAMVEVPMMPSSRPALEAGYAAWWGPSSDPADMNNYLHGYDLAGREAFTIAAVSSAPMYSPHLDGDHVVWFDYEGPAHTIPHVYAYDLRTRAKRALARVYGTVYQPPDVDGDYVVWVDHGPEPAPTSSYLYGYDLTMQEQFTIAQVQTLPMYPPPIENGYVLWPDQDPNAPKTYLHGARIYRVLNDRCEDAIALAEGVPYEGSSLGAITSTPAGCGFNDTRGVWHTYVPPAGGQVTVSLDGSAFDTTLAVFKGCGAGELACNDDYTLDHPQSMITMPMVRDKTYWIRVAGVDGAGGDYRILLTRDGCSTRLQSDLNADCRVDFTDLAVMCSEWMMDLSQ